MSDGGFHGYKDKPYHVEVDISRQSEISQSILYDEFGPVFEYEPMLSDSDGHALEISTTDSVRRRFRIDEKCAICYQDLAASAQDLWRCPMCEVTACKDCFSFWLETKIFTGHAKNLKCISCPGPIFDGDIREICGERTYRKLLYFTSRSELRGNPYAVWCPKDSCWSLIYGLSVPLNETIHSLNCPDCATPVCVNCGEVNHPEKSCPSPSPSVIEIARVSRAKMWTKIHTKKCPECRAPIQRSGGCKHMRCAVCNSHFCWLCRGFLKEFEPANSKKRLCVCNRIQGVTIWTVFLGGTIIGLPIVAASALVIIPPALAWYAVSSSTRKQHINVRLRAFINSLEEVAD
jgi:IBR domain, a half RING-finger domain